jgi:DNA-directed RNA polymerase sigma subunit (sigma70/sigma32)
LHATDEDDEKLEVLIADPNDKPGNLLLEAKEDLEDVNKELGKLMLALNNFSMWPERNKTIFSKYYGFDGIYGRNMEEIGEEYGITRARTQQIIEKTFELLKEAGMEIDEDGLADLLRTRDELTDFISTDVAD